MYTPNSPLLMHTHTHTQGIGLNAQGFADAILFCVFTKQVRSQLIISLFVNWERLKQCCFRGLHSYQDFVGGSNSREDELTKVLYSSGQTYGSSLASAEENELVVTLSE